jgi:tRNA/tmRNA/rRNA uracil-C5-methylase (TrmA/RlmC/RlmD family)
MNKLSKFCYELSKFTEIKPEIYLSSATGYRARAEFGFNKNSYTMVVDEQKIYMDKSSIPHPCIQKLMPNLLSKINNSELMQKNYFK